MVSFLANVQHLLFRLGGWSLFAGIIYIVGICIYRLYFHPLAKYPGPFFAKITTWRAVYHGKSGDLHVDIWRCHQKYGPIVRYAPHRIVFASSTGFHDIYDFGKNVHKSQSYRSIPLIKGAYSTLNVVDKKVHGRKRRILSQGLSDQNLKRWKLHCSNEKQDNFSPEVASDTEDGWTCPKNMAEWSDFYTFDVMTELVFSRSFNTLETNTHHYILDGIMSQMRRMSLLTEEPLIEKLHLGRFLYPGAMAKALRFSQAGRSIMEDRKRHPNPWAADICTKLLSAKDPETGEGFPFQELWAESNLLIVAGSDTTSTAMAAAFFYLSRCPRALSQATHEIRRAFTSIIDIRPGSPTLASCSYFRACIDEAMRLTPSVAGALWREVLPGEAMVDGEFVPAGMEVGAGIYPLHHIATYFPDPFGFRPERWLASSTGGKGVDPSEFAPFSAGPRSCVGKRLAMIEFTVVLARILWRVDLRAAAGELEKVGEGKGVRVGEYHTDWCFTSKKNGPYIQFRERRVVV
ncbi:cytochrome P450 [Aspergillus brunneoviolaceus CBS 621.78]|uniref:Cytochrome P450 n=1 Tax=Aspergillus brunneoviolaceus CBS 621.78 TaxID=1450534 RepID=A0ACD1G0M4_9EURO|nr:putative cytochrome P450 [Aspergillus brunneoviolaceus CBS 621.78]RAH42807.1 putative cytochrome P450 [Aspergillus brunneoviolaceus CBS 621.78]